MTSTLPKLPMNKAINNKNQTCHFAFCSILLFVMVGCASVEPDKKPADAIEMSGVVSDISSIPHTDRLNEGLIAHLYSTQGITGVMLAKSIDSEIASRSVKSIVVGVSPSLSLTIPVNGQFQAGECVKLFIDPIYREIVSRQNVPVMSMATGSTFVQRVACQY